ncbi:inward rectifier potassium channel [Actimicrobium sp. GrIS 1.19]|uniref:ion channel n=1 Tax=Actimicrobium sp. GrIS 1.19 TaxID=3071708 RepID=UPI002DF97C03|nr:inward rectifier potassium channel [Actimicrobium sp. GrIS 1.19]
MRGVDFRDPYYLAMSMPTRWFALLTMVLYLLINILFAGLYALSPGSVANARPGEFWDLFFFSVETLATVGYGTMAPATTYGHVMSAIEILAGMTFTAIITGIIFVRFSKSRSKIRFADVAVITAHNGHPTLMLRIGNARASLLSNAVAHVSILMPEKTLEGTTFRRTHELEMLRPRLPVFALTWTLMHEITEDSPLHGHDAASLSATGVRLFVIFEARDHALASVVYDVKEYRHDDFRFGMRFQDSISIDSYGRTVADLNKLSALEPDSTAKSA